MKKLLQALCAIFVLIISPAALAKRELVEQYRTAKNNTGIVSHMRKLSGI